MTPTINPRFIVRPRFGKITVPILTADGHIDYAHQVGLISSSTQIINQERTVEDDGSVTRWCTVKVTICCNDVKDIEGKKKITVDGIACASTRDKFVKEPGYEVAVAETRALKRAIAVAYNITDLIINPTGTTATREFVDLPFRKGVIDEDEDDIIPSDLKKSPVDILGDTGQDF